MNKAYTINSNLHYMYEDLIYQIRESPSFIETVVSKIDEVKMGHPFREGA